jgi:hypothetical protein
MWSGSVFEPKKGLQTGPEKVSFQMFTIILDVFSSSPVFAFLDRGLFYYYFKNNVL